MNESTREQDSVVNSICSAISGGPVEIRTLPDGTVEAVVRIDPDGRIVEPSETPGEPS